MHASQAAAFREDGAVFVPNFLDAAQLARCKAFYDWGLANPGPHATVLFGESKHRTVVDNSNPASVERLNALVASLPVGDLLAELWGSEHVWYYAEELFAKEGGQAGPTSWHQDTSYLPWAGEHWANLWISFEKLPKRNSIEIVRGSHHGIRYDGTTFANPNDPTDPLHGDQAVPALPRLPDVEAARKANPEAFDIVSWAVEPGDVVVLHPNSLHGGAPLDAGCPDRHTLVLRFFGDDATFRSLPANSRSRYTQAGVLHLKQIAHLNDGDPYRSPFFPQLR